jgi:two-component system, response regulator RegA
MNAQLYALRDVTRLPTGGRAKFLRTTSIPTAITAMKRGADHYMSKPADAGQVLAAYESLRAAAEVAPEVPVTVPSLARVEWEHMQRVISDCGGNISQAARLLGIHRRSLQRKLEKYPPSR